MTGLVDSVKKTLSLRRKNKEEKAADNAATSQPANTSDHDDIDESMACLLLYASKIREP